MIATALEAALAFTLACTGTIRTGPIGVALPETGGDPIEITYRIDIDARQWCSDACETTEPLASAAGGIIVLREHHHPAGSHVIMVYPAAGRFTDTLIEGDTATLRSGACQPAPFAGFPSRIA